MERGEEGERGGGKVGEREIRRGEACERDEWRGTAPNKRKMPRERKPWRCMHCMLHSEMCIECDLPPTNMPRETIMTVHGYCQLIPAAFACRKPTL